MSQKYQLNMLDLDLLQERYKEAQDLIEKMIYYEPKKRPDANILLKHLFFWSNDKKLKLIQDLSNHLEFNYLED